MPFYKVRERRAYYRDYLIEADNDIDAGRGTGRLVEDDDRCQDSWGDDLVSVEEVEEGSEL